jgi:hypothetical protein
MRGKPTGCIGSGNTNGRMQEKYFVILFELVQRYTSAIKEKTILLL